MKLINIHYTGFGGIAAVVNSLVTAAGAQDHEWVMGYYGVAPLDASHTDFCTKHGFRYAVFRPKPRNPWAAWRQLTAWLMDEQPDAIICHSSTAIPPCAWVARRSHIPLIAVEHTPNEVKSRNEWMGSLAAMLQADRVVVLTEVYAKLLAAGLGPAYQPRKVRYISNGVSTDRFYPASLPTDTPNVLRAGMAGRLAATKRHDLLIDIAHKLGLALEFAGDGECMDSLQARATVKQNAQITFRGLIPEAKMPKWFRGLDLYLHASSGETFSMAVLQAMATGLPIIASDITGMDEVLGRDETCGLLVPNTHSAWCDAVLLLAKDHQLRDRMGKAARQRAEEYFSTRAMFDKYFSLLSENQ